MDQPITDLVSRSSLMFELDVKDNPELDKSLYTYENSQY